MPGNACSQTQCHYCYYGKYFKRVCHCSVELTVCFRCRDGYCRHVAAGDCRCACCRAWAAGVDRCCRALAAVVASLLAGVAVGLRRSRLALLLLSLFGLASFLPAAFLGLIGLLVIVVAVVVLALLFFALSNRVTLSCPTSSTNSLGALGFRCPPTPAFRASHRACSL